MIGVKLVENKDKLLFANLQSWIGFIFVYYFINNDQFVYATVIYLFIFMMFFVLVNSIRCKICKYQIFRGNIPNIAEQCRKYYRQNGYWKTMEASMTGKGISCQKCGEPMTSDHDVQNM